MTTQDNSITTPQERFEALLLSATEAGARSLLLIPEEPPIIRGDGGLERLDEVAPLSAASVEAFARVLVGEEGVRVGPEIGEITRWYLIHGVVNARCVVSRAAGRLTVSVAMIPSRLPLPETIRLPETFVERVCGAGHGLVLCTGPSGCGKTTTAFSLLEHINLNHAWHIATVEDPVAVLVEPRQAVVQQRQVGHDCPGVLSGIRAAMSQDADVIFIGELSDVEVVQAALTVASTGHLVVTQLAAPSAVEAIAALIDVFPEELRQQARERLALSLRAVTNQRLVRGSAGEEQGARRRWQAAYEVLHVDEATSEAIRAGALDAIEHGGDSQTLRADLERMREEGLISEEMVEAASGSLRGRLHG